MNAITFWVKLKKTPRRCERHGVLGKIEKKTPRRCKRHDVLGDIGENWKITPWRFQRHDVQRHGVIY